MKNKNQPLCLILGREIAFHALQKWENQKKEIQQNLEALFLQQTPVLEKALAYELAHGVIRRKFTLDEVIRQYSNIPASKISTPVRSILRLGLYQLLYLDRVPEYAAVNESVKLAKQFSNPAAVRFINGILRTFLRKKKKVVFPDHPVQALSLRASCPMELAQRWVDLWGLEQAEVLCEIANARPLLSLRVNTLKISRDILLSKLKEEGIEAAASFHHPLAITVTQGSLLTETDCFRAGLFQVQDETMLSVVDALELKPAMKVLDLCSAPGTKATAMAERMQNKGKIFSVDLSDLRLKKIFENCSRLGIDCIDPVTADVRKIDAVFKIKFDRILIDAPCSNTGVLGKRVEARWRFSLRELDRLAKFQGEMLESALKLLSPEGILVYATCSIDPKENEEVIQKILKNHAEMKLTEEKKTFPSASHGGGYWAKLKNSPAS